MVVSMHSGCPQGCLPSYYSLAARPSLFPVFEIDLTALARSVLFKEASLLTN